MKAQDLTYMKLSIKRQIENIWIEARKTDYYQTAFQTPIEISVYLTNDTGKVVTGSWFATSLGGNIFLCVEQRDREKQIPSGFDWLTFTVFFINDHDNAEVIDSFADLCMNTAYKYLLCAAGKVLNG